MEKMVKAFKDVNTKHLNRLITPYDEGVIGVTGTESGGGGGVGSPG